MPLDFIAHVKSYYVDPIEDSQIQGRDEVTPRHGITSNVDRPFLEQVWTWLVKNPDVRLGNHAGHKQLTLSEVEARNAAIEQSEQSVPITRETDLLETVAPSLASNAPAIIQDDENTQINKTTETTGAEAKDAAVPQRSKLNAEIRLFASESRMWHTLAGHGPDFSKVKSLDFICLSIIAASGPKGILQHDLVKISGQDKRSLPARTDRLRDGGYVEKRRVCVQLFNPKRLLNTSQCILKRFVNSESDLTQQTSDPGSVPAGKQKRKHKRKSAQSHQASQAAGQSSSTVVPVSMSGNMALSRSRAVPLWTSDRSINNQIFGLIDRAGIKGMSMTVGVHFLSQVVSGIDSLIW